MPRQGNGRYTPPTGQPVVSATTVSSSVFNALVTDLGAEITRSISTDGQTPMAAALPMGGFSISSMGAGAQDTDALRRDQLTGTGASQGANLAGFKQTGSSSTARTVGSKLSDFVTVSDGGVDITGVADCSAKVNAMLLEHSLIRFTPGTYLFTQDMIPQAGNNIVVEQGAKLIFNGPRMTAYLKSNISLAVFGEISFTNTTAAAGQAGWPADVGGAGPTTTNERGAIEFGGISSSLQTGFIIYGTGKIHGDWTGTPSLTNLWTGDLNFKGIATFYGNNIDISGVEVYGFRGEAVYYYTSVAAKNVNFHDLFVHDVNFNALNFNVTAELSNSFIENNVVDVAWQGVELSSGTARKNTVRNCQSFPFQLGGGVVLTVNLDDNDIYVNALQGLNGINAVGNPASITGVVTSTKNRIYGATQSGVYASALTSFKSVNDVVIGYASNVTAATSAYGINVDANVARATIRDPICSGAGSGANGSVRCLSPNPNVKGVQTEDGSGNLLNLTRGPISSATTTQRDYMLINGVGASGIGFETVYANGVPENLIATSPFAKTSAILTAVAGGEVGTYTISTYKPLGSSTLAASVLVDNFGQLQPAQDNSFALGIAGRRWSVIYAGTGTINTSDERSKTPAQPIESALLRAWGKVQFCQFKYLDAVSEKGDGARWHIGVIAQRVKEAFESEGLNPFAYGVLCYDEWPAQPAVIDADGRVSIPAIPAGNRYGIRYEEALALECAYLRSKLQG